ncbi:hypothetical protein BGW36DRAFT_384462 [Talaromyces proteolyticus]|uniref:GCN5-related N-acetyltransferase Rv2170-like domain-containing protein n=1 Tax=Talaromyces proteolyticus TaxID=1131652 RepID=A0AAD4PW36_9EURO|nr:uncharacterized protein BGW36DRAFT_384462 [Talaromyces proteolyticus]KAH8694147.1 hypothetical protein BGW36DRAFT_384462 [Talaromyces proteolyticus]
MNPVQFFKHEDPSLILQYLSHHLPATIAIFHRIQSPQNAPERHACLFASFPPNSSLTELDLPVTVSFVDRSRHNEAQLAIFNSLCLQVKRPEDLSKESYQLLSDHLRQLLKAIKDIGDSFATADIKPLNYPFSSTLRSTALHEVIATVLVNNLGQSKVYHYLWDQWLFSTATVKDLILSRRLPEGYELGKVPPEQIDLVVSTSKVKRQATTLLSNPNSAILFTNKKTKQKEAVAWAHLTVDKSLSTLYVLPEHRGKGLAKMVAGSLIRDLCDGTLDSEKTQSDWCIAQVAADNVESQAVCKSLGAELDVRTATVGIELDSFVDDNWRI